MARIAFLPHHHREAAGHLTLEAIKWLHHAGHEIVVPEGECAPIFDQWAVPAADLCAGLDLAVSVGGDGTMLRTIGLVAGHEVPVLGVNVGHLGYLTEVEPDEMTHALKRFLAGEYQVARRMTLAVTIEQGNDSRTISALNEVVLEKTSSGHTVRLSVSINGTAFTNYAADGLILATPTGSTAYNLSARGPIVSPGHRALLVTPVSPHMLFDRTLVLDPTETVGVSVLDGRRATVVLDGREVAAFGPGDSLSCSAGESDALLVTFGERNFHQILKTKFGLSDR